MAVWGRDPGRVLVGRATPISQLHLPDEVRNLHLRIAGEPGTGKTMLAALIAVQDAARRIPLILVDGTGGLINTFVRLAKTHRQGADILDRFVYFPINRFDYCHGFPFFVRDPRLSAYDHAQILIETIMRVTPGLEEIATTLRHVGTTTSMALYEAGYQVTEAERFLEDDIFRERVLEEVKERLPQVVHFYRQQYKAWPLPMKSEQSRSFKTKVSPFTLSEELRAIVGQDKPTISFQRLELGKLVIALDLSQIKEYPAQVIGSVFIDRLSQYIFGKPPSECEPISLIVDEAATLLAHPGLAKDFREFQAKARQYLLWMCVCHQTMHQLEETLRTGLWSIAGQLVFRQNEIESAQEVARNLIPGDPFMRKFAFSSGNPTAMPISEQMWSHGNWIQTLPDRRCIARLYEAPGFWGRPRAWRVRMMTTPTVQVGGVSDQQVEDEKLKSLKRFGRPVAEALKEVRERVRRHAEKGDRPLRDKA